MTKNKKRLLILLPLYTALVVLATVVVYDAYRISKQRLFDYTPEEVSAILFYDSATMTGANITNPDTVQEIVEMLNGFTYSSVEHLPPAGYFSRQLTLEGTFYRQPREFSIEPDFVRFSGRGVGSTVYTSAKPGYLQPLIDLLTNEKEEGEPWDSQPTPEGTAVP